MDPVGNWSDFQENANGDDDFTDIGDLDQDRTHNKANEITDVTEDAGSAWNHPAYDKMGNTTTLPQPSDLTSSYTGAYDAWSQLMEVKEGGTDVAKYEYDGRGRRIIKKKYTAGSLNETGHYYYSNTWRVLEERADSSSNADRQFIWGIHYTAELVLRELTTI